MLTRVFFIFLIITISIVISLRSDSLGADTKNYISIFISNSTSTRYEPGFNFLISSINLLTDNYVIFFFLISFIITFFYWLSFNSITDLKKNYLFFCFLFVSFLLFSNWYLSNVTNGLRQGLSLSILYYGLIKYLMYNRYSFFVIYFIFALIFHYSIILLIPFFIVYLILSFKYFFCLWLILGIFYFLNINEAILLSLSLKNEYINFLYTSIKNYAIGEEIYYGFNIYFFIYTITYPLISLSIYFFKKNKDILTLALLKIYLLLTMPYFFFGFANFANRYALIAWAFIPFIQVLIMYQLRLNNKRFIFLAVSIMIFSIIYFSLIKLELFLLFY